MKQTGCCRQAQSTRKDEDEDENGNEDEEENEKGHPVAAASLVFVHGETINLKKPTKPTRTQSMQLQYVVLKTCCLTANADV